MRDLRVSGLALAAVLTALACAPSSGDAGQSNPLIRVQNVQTSAPGEGALCALAIYGVVAETGRTCFPGQNLAAQAQFDGDVARLKAYVLANDKSYTPDSLEQFMREKGGVGTPKEQLCASQMAGLYQSLVPKTVSVHAQIDAVVARPGAPTWGACLDEH